MMSQLKLLKGTYERDAHSPDQNLPGVKSQIPLLPKVDTCCTNKRLIRAFNTIMDAQILRTFMGKRI